MANELVYQWFKEKSDGTNYKLETTGKTIKLSPLSVTDAGTYQCVVTCDKLGEWKIESNLLIVKEVKSELSAYSRARLVLIYPWGFCIYMYPIDGKAEIATLPHSPTFMIGDEVTLICTVRNVSDRITNELTYQWFKERSDGTDHKLETTGETMKLSPLSVTDAGMYRCVITYDKLEEWKTKSHLFIMPEIKSEL